MRCWYRVRLPYADRWMPRSTPRHLSRDGLEASCCHQERIPRVSSLCVGFYFFDLTRIRVRGWYLVLCGSVFFSNVSLNPSQRNMSNFIFYFQPSESYDIQILDPFVIQCAKWLFFVTTIPIPQMYKLMFQVVMVSYPSYTCDCKGANSSAQPKRRARNFWNTSHLEVWMKLSLF